MQAIHVQQEPLPIGAKPKPRIICVVGRLVSAAPPGAGCSNHGFIVLRGRGWYCASSSLIDPELSRGQNA